MYGTPGPQRTAYVAQPQSYVVQRAAQVVRQVVDEGPYTLDTGDKLRVVVFGQDALSNSYTVDAQGNVALPLVGAVTARGITTEQLAGSITARLKQSYLRDPSVAVEVEVYRPFFVLGEVTYPGQYPFVPNMTVENAIAIAGGFTPRAYRDKVTVTRKVQGVPGRMTLPLRYPLRPGDTIEVSERWF
jgi:polysaccharide export outer membrane protein